MAKRKKRANGEGSVFQRSDGRWQAALTVGTDTTGRQVKKVVTGKTQNDVLQKIRPIRERLGSGNVLQGHLMVSELLHRWLEHKERQVKPRTAEYYRYYIVHYIEPNLKNRRLVDIAPLDVQAMVTSVADGVSANAANKSRAILKSALHQAVRWQLLNRNPVDAVDPLRDTPRDVQLWTPKQVRMFLAEAKQHRLYPAFYLAITTGMRHGEVLGVRWQDLKGTLVHVHQSLITVKNQPTVSTPKTKKGKRLVALPPDTLELLKAHGTKQREQFRKKNLQPTHDLIFTSKVGTPMNPRNFARTWYELQDAAKVPRARFHDLRHLHVSLLVKRGLDVQTIADRVGHTDPSFTLRQYSHMFHEQRQNAVFDLDELLEQPGKKG